MGHSPTIKPKAVESSLGGPRVFLTSAHINKLMIIAKRENHTYGTYNKQQKGKLERKTYLSYNYIILHSQIYTHHPIML